MSDRFGRLEVARRIDWRFLLPSPALGRVAWLGQADAEERAAVASAGGEVGAGTQAELARRGPWDLIVADAVDPVPALGLVRPGGWVLHRGSGRALWRVRATRRDLLDAGAERVDRHWFLPDMRHARRIVSLDDRDAVLAVLTRRGGSASRRALAAAARPLVRAGVPAELLAGEAAVLASRPGGPALPGWPALSSLSARLREWLGPSDPSWILLTPRFPASAHVVLLLLAGGDVRLVAKIARLADDDGPRHEGRILEALATAGLPPGAAPSVVAVADVDGHTALVETAIHGRLLDRRLVRRDPARAIAAVGRWLANIPRSAEPGFADLADLVLGPMRRAVVARPDDRSLAALTMRTEALVAPLADRRPHAVPEHGDLSHPNLVVRPDGELGVLDWERARLDGLPLNDLCFFLGYVALAREGETADPIGGLERLLADRASGAAAALHAEAARCGVARTDLPALLVTCWARAFAGQVEDGWQGDPRARDGEAGASRYYRMWEGAVDRQAHIGALLI